VTVSLSPVNSTRHSPLLTVFLVLSASSLIGAFAFAFAAIIRSQHIEEGSSSDVATQQPAMQAWDQMAITLGLVGVSCAIAAVAVNVRGGQASATAMPRPAPPIGPPAPPMGPPSAPMGPPAPPPAGPPFAGPPQQPHPGPQGPVQA
jgi:hypothetical protein